MALPKSVRIREVGPREGFQTLPQVIPTADKLALIDCLSSTGVSEIEVASFVRADKLPQMADAEQIVAGLQVNPKVRYTALYLNERGFERAEALGKLDNAAWISSAVSRTFLQRNANTTPEEVLSKVTSWGTLFRKHGKASVALMISTAFGCNYEGAVSTQQAAELIQPLCRKVQDTGLHVHEICLADTMGWANPRSVRDLVRQIRACSPGSEVTLHLHDTRGTGMANVYAGLEEGVSCFDCSVGGMGGCPFADGAAGNVPTEDVVYLCQSLGIETGISLERYVTAAELACKITGQQLPGRYHRASARSCMT